MFAKGFAVGIQFEEMFKDGLYFDLANQTNIIAEELRKVLIQNGLKVGNSPTNQVFVTVDKELGNSLIKEFGLEKWSEDLEEMTVRFVVSFKTTLDDVKAVDEFLNR